MSLPSSKATLLLLCLTVALSTSVTRAAPHHPGAARKLLDGVQLQKADSLVSLKHPDGSDITPASLYNSLRDTFNGYFTQEPADAEVLSSSGSPAESPAEDSRDGTVLTRAADAPQDDDLDIYMLSSRPDGNRRLHQAQAAAAKKAPAAPAPPAKQATAAKTAAPVVVDMTNSPLQKFMLSSRPPSARAKIEGPAEEAGNAPVFDGSGKKVSGGRKLSQASDRDSRVSLQPRQQDKSEINSPPRVPGRVSIDDTGRAAGSARSSSFDAFGRPLTQPLSGGRKLGETQAAPVAKKTAAPAASAQKAAAAKFLASRTSAPTVVDMSNSQLQKTLLAPPNANGRAKIEGPEDAGNAAVFDGSGKKVSGGRKLSQAQATTAKKTTVAATPAKQGAVKVDMPNSAVQKTLLAPPNSDGRAKIEGPADKTGTGAVFDGSGKFISGNGR